MPELIGEMEESLLPLLFNGGNDDPWLAPDKLYHLLFCLSLTFFFSKLASLSRYSFLRRYSLRLGSLLSLSAGAAKEAADQFGLFPSSGASVKDAVADLLGVLIAALALSVCTSKAPIENSAHQTRKVLPV